MAIATQEVFAHTKAGTWPVAKGTPGRTLVESTDGRFGVTIADAPGGTARQEIEVGPFKMSRAKPAGVGYDEATAISDSVAGVALDGTWEFEGVEGAVLATPQNAEVYVDAEGDLTLDDAAGTLLGTVNYPGTYAKVAGTLPIKIGV